MAPPTEGGSNGNGPRWRIPGYGERRAGEHEQQTVTAEATAPEAPQPTLQSLIARGGKLPLPAALVMFEDVLGALDSLHRLGLIHGHVRPGEIAIEADGRCRLGGGAAPPEARGHGGGLRYTAPEVLFRGARWTTSADLYAAAVVLYEALTGQPPLLGVESLAEAPIPIVARSLLEEGLARDARERPAGAARYQQDLSVAADAFLGAAWRAGGRAWLAAAMRALQSDRELVGAPWGRRTPAEAPEESEPAAAPAPARPEAGAQGAPIVFLGRRFDRRQRLIAGGALVAGGVLAILLVLVALGGSSPRSAPSLPYQVRVPAPTAQATPTGPIFGTPPPTPPPQSASPSPSTSPTAAPTPVPAHASPPPVVPAPVVQQPPQPTPTSCLLVLLC